MTDQSYDQVNQQPANDEEGGIEVNEKQFKASQQKPEQARPILMSFADQDQDTPFQAASAAKAPLSPFKKAVVAITFVGGCTGLFAGLASLKADRSEVEGKSPSTSRDIDGTSSVSEPSMSTFAQLPHFDASILEGYPGTDGCDDLEVDLLEALGLMTNITIDSLAKSHFQNPWFPTCRGGLGTDCWVAFEPTEDYYIVQDREFISDGIPVADAPVEITDEMGSIPNERGEDSFGTNNQVQGVDEADIVKSDGTNVYSAYGDKLVVWNVDGELLSETTIPTDDDNGVDICEKKFKIWNSTSECYSQDSHGGWYHYRQRERKASIAFPSPSEPIKIASLLLHEGKLTVIATTSYKLNTSTSKLENERNTRLFMYDVSDANLPTDGSALTLIARKDLHGKYQTARSIGSYSHVVSSSSLATRSHLDEYLYPWSKEYAGMNETEYRSAALEVARNKTAIFASDLTDELAQLFGNDCSKLAKIAVMLREQTSDTDTDGDAMLPSFTDSSVLKSLTQVHSFDMNQQSFVQTKMANSYPKIGTTSSGIFFPTASYTTNVYASSEKLVVSGEAYTQDADGEWNERTVLLVYGLEEDSSIPQAVGEVPGSLLNQFSMDHNKVDDVDYLRVATTSWAKWGLVNGTWGQTESSESQITVLKIPNDSEDTSVMEEVGSVDGIGVDERIYAARFFGDKAYVVTFRMIDPFYTVDMSIPDDPKVVGELKIPGFSNYLHPVNDTLILAIGQNATVQGRTDGLMISLFDVSDFAFPKKIREFVEDHSASSSDAQYDHRAFRYLPDSKLLILPLEINQSISNSSPLININRNNFFRQELVHHILPLRFLTMLIYNINLKKLAVTIFLAFNAAHQSTIQHSLLGVSAAPVVSINGHNISNNNQQQELKHLARKIQSANSCGAPDSIVQVCGASYGTCGTTESVVDTATGRGAVRCCANSALPNFSQYTWGLNGAAKTCPGVWAESEISGTCHQDVSFCEAESICSSAGARLCTREEVWNDCTRDSGCGFDNRMVWTSDVETSDNSCQRPDQTHVVCGYNDDVNINQCGTLEDVVDTTSYQAVRCCSDTAMPDWTKYNRCDVWTESKLGGGDICFSKATYCEAKSICENNGGRLCTRQEMLNGCTVNTGCGFNAKKVWSSDYTPEDKNPEDEIPSGAGGDPHYVPLQAPAFSFHGQCDTVLMASKLFASGLGIHLHARTTRVDNARLQQSYSYISAIALMIGPDILEVQEDGSILKNGVDDFLLGRSAEDEGEVKEGFFAGFDIAKSFKGSAKKIIVYKLTTLEQDVSIEIRCNTKSRMIFVDLFGTFPDDTVGLLGNPNHDRLFARDGKTDLTGAWNTLGDEWQVRADEPKLFDDKDRYPQHPVGCVYTAIDAKPNLRRRLTALGDDVAEEVTVAEAEKVCAHASGIKRQFCIDDVMATGDLELAADTFYN